LDGKELLTIPINQEGVTDVSFSPNGKALISLKDGNAKPQGIDVDNGRQTDVNGSIKVWSIDLDNLMKLGCDWARDYLQTNPAASESDRQMCGITKGK
jgi:hypothetical protein